MEVNFEIRPTSLRLNPLYSTISMLLRLYLRVRGGHVGGLIHNIMIIILATIIMMNIFIHVVSLFLHHTTHFEETGISRSCLFLSIRFIFVFYLLNNFAHWMSNILHFAILNICSALCSSSSCKSCSALCC